MSGDSQKGRSTKLSNGLIALLLAAVAIGAYLLLGVNAGSHVQ
jgi:hypothetical protein